MRPFRERYEQHARCWSVAPAATPDNRESSRTPIQQLTGRLGSSIGHRPVAYNDEVTALRVGYNGTIL
jgi:hypothetical protein